MKKIITKPSKKILLGIVIVIIAVIAILEVVGVTRVFHKGPNPEATKTTTTGGASTFSDKGEGAQNATSSNTADSGDSYAGAKTDGNNGASATLLAPSGTFVSAHHQVPMDAALTSVCNTTPGATCEIIFSSGSSERSLEIRTADSNGAVFWDRWTPRASNLTPGVWNVKAKAMLNGQTKSTTDALTLEIVS
jgi:hypothetical protein